MEDYKFLFDLGVILLSTKVLGLITRQMKMPQVVGALLAGLILGPAMLGVITETDFIHATAEIGVVILMFCAGMETDVNELKKSGKASLVIAILGVVVPLASGFLVAYIFNRDSMIKSDAACSVLLQNIFIGVILTATSVSITVETLKEMGKLKTRSGNAILGAAIIDDILGVIALTIITSMADSSVKIETVLIKTVLFFVVVAIVGFVFYKVYTWWSARSERGLQRHVIVAFVFCLFMSYAAEEIFGVADITGAFFAGLIISMTEREQFVASRFDILSFLYLSPVFFASIGLKVELPAMDGTIVLFSVVLVLVAILSKVVGCGVGAKLCGYQNYQAMRIGVGMVSRGEVALIVASKGTAVGLIGSQFLGPVVIVVLITTILTPIILKPVFKRGVAVPIDENTGFGRNYEKVAEYREGIEAKRMAVK